MSSGYTSDDLFFLLLKHERRKKLNDGELVGQFETAERMLDDAIDAYNNQLAHLVKNLYKAFNSPDANAVVRMRRYVGIQHRIIALDRAAFAIRSAYADIWQALELALEDAPMKAVSAKARLGYVGKITKNAAARAKAEAMRAIHREWVEMQKAGAKRRMTDAEFARKMHAKYGGVITSEGSIKNRISKWRKERAKVRP